MLALALLSLLGSAATTYLIGYAYAAPRASWLRSKRGILLIVVLALTFVPLPPQLLGLEKPMASLGGYGITLAWPQVLPTGVYIALWLVTSVAALLAGVRIWQIGTPDWRSGANRAYDASPASRATSLLPMADTITDALDTLARAGVGPKDVATLAEAVRGTGRRFADSLPPSDGEVYRLVAGRLPAAVAASVTGLLLEGAGRRAAR